MCNLGQNPRNLRPRYGDNDDLGFDNVSKTASADPGPHLGKKRRQRFRSTPVADYDVNADPDGLPNHGFTHGTGANDPDQRVPIGHGCRLVPAPSFVCQFFRNAEPLVVVTEVNACKFACGQKAGTASKLHSNRRA